MSFDSRIPFNQDCSNAEDMEREAIFRFKAYNLYRRHEPFYLAYPDCMQQSLLPNDYARFEQRWREVDVRMQDVYPITPHIVTQIGTNVLKFDIHMVEILHLDRLLFVAYYEPANDGAGNRELCEAFFTRYGPKDKYCVRAWGLRGRTDRPLEMDNRAQAIIRQLSRMIEMMHTEIR